MDYLLTQYKSAIKPLLKPLGFKMYNGGRKFARIIDDEVVQSLSLVRVPGLYVCHIRFGLIPLCRGSSGYSLDGEELSMLWGKFENWMYDPRDEDRVDEIVSIVAKGVRDYLIPYFERTQTCKEAYEAFLELEEKNNMQRKLDPVKLDFCLKTGEYKQAAYYINEILKNYKVNYENIRTSPHYDEQTREFKLNRLQKNTEKFTDLLRRVESNDAEYIDRLIKREEKNLIACYKAKKHIEPASSHYFT